jgi:hypothetical protein
MPALTLSGSVFRDGIREDGAHAEARYDGAHSVAHIVEVRDGNRYDGAVNSRGQSPHQVPSTLSPL